MLTRIMKVLFICNQNQNRSRKAALLFRDRFETKSAGLYNKTPVDKEQLSWADLIVVMEDAQRNELGQRFPEEYLKKRILSLDVPDIYSFEQPELDEILNNKINELI